MTNPEPLAAPDAQQLSTIPDRSPQRADLDQHVTAFAKMLAHHTGDLDSE